LNESLCLVYENNAFFWFFVLRVPELILNLASALLPYGSTMRQMRPLPEPNSNVTCHQKKNADVSHKPHSFVHMLIEWLGAMLLVSFSEQPVKSAKSPTQGAPPNLLQGPKVPTNSSLANTNACSLLSIHDKSGHPVLLKVGFVRG